MFLPCKLHFAVAFLTLLQTTRAGTIPHDSQNVRLKWTTITAVPTFLQGVTPRVWSSGIVTWGSVPVVMTNAGLVYSIDGVYQPVPTAAISLFQPVISQIPFVSTLDPEFRYINSYGGYEVYFNGGAYFASISGVMTPIPGFFPSTASRYNFAALSPLEPVIVSPASPVLPIVTTVPTSSSHSSHSETTKTETTTTTTTGPAVAAVVAGPAVAAVPVVP